MAPTCESPGRVTLGPRDQGPIEYNEEEIRRLAHNTLIGANGQIMERQLEPVSSDSSAASSTPSDEKAGIGATFHQHHHHHHHHVFSRPTEEVDDVDIEDNELVYLTDSFRTWERHYLKRLAKRIHRMVVAELDHRCEEALFMLFMNHDTNLDGVVRGIEATKLLDSLAAVAPGISESEAEKRELIAADGSISFISLLTWFTDADGSFQETNLGFAVTSLTVGILGSGVMSADARLEVLDWVGLRRNVIGYRRLLAQVRRLKEERILAPVRDVESQNGVEAAMPLYYEALAREFEGDFEFLFELFCEVDISGNMVLEATEVLQLLRLLDTDASERDSQRYLAEINMSDGPLNFANLIDWWEQARNVPESLVSQKGAGLIASVKAHGAGRRLSGIFMETNVQTRWQEAKADGRLPALGQAYCRTLNELRKYKMERDLDEIEVECAHL